MLRSLRLVLSNSGGVRHASTLPQCEHILVKDHSDGVFNVQLNRPEQRNSFTLQVWKYVHHSRTESWRIRKDFAEISRKK